jgi:hypothetical protein
VTKNTYHTGIQLAKELGCHYYECSAMTQRNIKAAFDKAVKVAMDLEPRQMKEDGGCLGLLDTCFAKDDKS